MLHIVIMIVLLIVAIGVVVVDIRRGKARAQAMVPEPVVEQIVPDEPRQALVVDDSPTMRATIRRLLEQQDYEVVEATDGREAVQRLADLTSSPSSVVAIVDGDLPGMDGVEFVRSVRADISKEGLRIVLMTSDRDADGIDSLVEDAGLVHLRKPFTSEALLTTLRSAG